MLANKVNLVAEHNNNCTSKKLLHNHSAPGTGASSTILMLLDSCWIRRNQLHDPTG